METGNGDARHDKRTECAVYKNQFGDNDWIALCFKYFCICMKRVDSSSSSMLFPLFVGDDMIDAQTIAQGATKQRGEKIREKKLNAL